MMNYPRYAEYRDPGVEWLGRIPAHWQEKRLKDIATYNDETLSDTTDPDYELEYVDISSVDSIQGIINQETMTFDRAPSRARRKVRDGDIIISTVRTYLKAIAAIRNPPDNLIVSTGFAVIRPKPKENSDYVGYLLQSEGFVGDVEAHSVGVSYPAINASVLASLPVVEPPFPEQQAIARFLDYKTAQIDALIAKKEALLARLAEKRAALISQAVTKGLNPSVPMKDSGVEWLGEIPAHWMMKRLKHVAKVQSGLTLGKRYSGDTVTKPYIRVANVQDGYLDLQTITTIEIPPDKVDRYRLHSGDVLMTEGGDFDKLGRGYVWDGQIDDCLHQNHVYAVRPNADKLDSHYLAALTSSLHGKNYFTRSSQQTTNLATINQTTLMNFEIPLPSISEQKRILDASRTLTERIDQQLTQVQYAIDKLNEYRTSLITHAVTGKIDVRNVPLPAVATEEDEGVR